MPDSLNELRLVAVLQQRGVIRFTPAGLPMLDTRVMHRSHQAQDSALAATQGNVSPARRPTGKTGARPAAARLVEFELAALFPGALASQADKLAIGVTLELTGFLAARRLASKALVLNVTGFSLIALPSTDEAASDSSDNQAVSGQAPDRSA